MMSRDLYMKILDCKVNMMTRPFNPRKKNIPRIRILFKGGVKPLGLFSVVLVYYLIFTVAYSSKSTNRLYLNSSTHICWKTQQELCFIVGFYEKPLKHSFSMLQEFIPIVRFTEEQGDLLKQFTVEVWLGHKFTFFQGQFRIVTQLGFQQRGWFQVSVSHNWIKVKKNFLNQLCKIGWWSHHSWFPVKSQCINISIIRMFILLNCLCALHFMLCILFNLLHRKNLPFDEIFANKKVRTAKTGWWSLLSSFTVK